MEEQEHEGRGLVLDQEEDYEDDALSLCDLAVGERDGDDPVRSPRHVRHSTAEELFEFLTDFGSEMCSAEDIITCGKLALSDVVNPVRRRSESLSEVELGSPNLSDISRSGLMRNCRSLDYDRIHHHAVGLEPRQQPRKHGNSSINEKSFPAMLDKNRSSSRPRWWYIIMFGPVKSEVHAMDRLRDIKSRQLRRSPSNLLFPSPETEVNRRDMAGRGGLKASSWKFLQLLSCQSRTSVAVSSSYPPWNEA
ncbi:hypothetical protein MLD38_007223 [Melastoma candidum]|uniref:Uncharacterized protein n=1 Tax=Melastoma candidum TaxID=119954 RepID=A0ACB9RQE3_9MYRT|nr:hypothetical protein MLD38_007223 [Melastoma candidum]